MRVSPALPWLHAITDERIARRADVRDIARSLALGGGSDLALHARGRQLSGVEHYELAARLSACAPARLFVNDRLDVALVLPTAGVQLGTDSLPVSAARALNPQWWIGKSVHDLTEAETACLSGADYLVVGPVYATATHPGRAALGLQRLHAIVGAAGDVPVIAIGGITLDRVREIRASGAHGIAAIRALWDDGDPGAAARAMREELVS